MDNEKKHLSIWTAARVGKHPFFFYEPSSFVRTKYGEVANDSMPKPTVSLVNHFKIQTRLLTTNEVDTKVVNPDKIIQRSDHK